MRSESGRLAPADEANIVLDRAGQVNVFLVAALLGPGGFIDADGTPDLSALRSALGRRVDALPALRRAIIGGGRGHRWVEAHPDMRHHVRLVEVTNEPEALERLCAHLMTVPLELDQPPWEILVAPRARGGQTAVILRIHHVLADGMAAVAIVRSLFDDARPDEPRPASTPVVRRSLLTRIAYALRRIRLTLSGHEVGTTVLLGERTDSRAVVFRDADLLALEARMRPQGFTVNDALLASVAAGYRAALSVAGERIPDRLPVSVPVALERRGAARNQVGVMLIRLPLTVSDPGERIIAAQTRIEKAAARDQGTLEFMRGPAGARIMNRLARRQRLVGGFVTNVRGPERAQRLAGAPIGPMWPVAVLAANVRLGVAALSVGGRLCLGIHFDAAHVPGAEFAHAVDDELRRLTV
jgi:diacylglycerol O-acyltransferase